MITQLKQGACRAVWLAGLAQGSAVPDHLMRKVDPVFPGKKGHEIKFNLDRITLLGKAYTLRQAFYVRIHNDSRDGKSAPKYDIRRLSPDSGEFNQGLHIVRNFSTMPLQKGLAASLDTFCLVAIKTGGADHFLQVGDGDFCKVFCRAQFFKECLGYLVDPLVGALGRQDGGNQKLQRVSVAQGSLDIRVGTT